jgi:intracellular sulfur oxidation DsrE/DsrF family protein
MTRLARIAIAAVVAAAAVTAPATLSAQTARAVIEKEGASPLVTGVTFPVTRDLPYRIAWGINVGPEKADSVVPGFRSPANFLVLADRNGVPKGNVHLAIVIWGSATHSLLRNDAYKAARGADNASIALLEALDAAGVQVIVCGEALVNRKLAASDLLPFVKVAPTATMALATLHAQGYATWMP